MWRLLRSSSLGVLALAAASCGEPTVRIRAADDLRPAVIIEPLESSPHDVLFADERAAIDEALESHFLAADSGYWPIPRATVERLAARARRGQLRAGGPICARPPSVDEVLAYEMPDTLLGVPRIVCEGGSCRLEVTIAHSMRAAQSGLTVARYGAVLPGALSESALVDAVSQLRELPIGDEEQPSGGGADAPPPAGVSTVALGGRWGSPPTAASAPELALESCRGLDRRAEASLDVSLAVDSWGNVRRCAVNTPSAARERCICRAWTEAIFPRGDDGRRVKYRLVDSPPSAPAQTASVVYRAEVHSPLALAGTAAGTALTSPEVAACQARAPAGSVTEAEVMLSVDAAGRAHGVRVFSDNGTQPCLVSALSQLAFPCTGEETKISATLQLSSTPAVTSAERE